MDYSIVNINYCNIDSWTCKIGNQINILTLKKHDSVIIIKCRHFEYRITRLDFDLGAKINGNKKREEF
jgi:hypothetical protein